MYDGGHAYLSLLPLPVLRKPPSRSSLDPTESQARTSVGLSLVEGRVPVWIHDDDPIRCSQRQAQAAHLGGHKQGREGRGEGSQHSSAMMAQAAQAAAVCV